MLNSFLSLESFFGIITFVVSHSELEVGSEGSSDNKADDVNVELPFKTFESAWLELSVKN